MKRIIFFSLVLTLGFLLRAPSLHAQEQDQNSNNTKELKASPKEDRVKVKVVEHDQKAEGAPRATKGTADVGRPVQKGTQESVTYRGDKSHGKVSADSTDAALHSPNAMTRSTETTARSSQQTNQRQSQQTGSPAFKVQGNRSNQYNGQWFAGNTHSDWGTSGYHRWNNHDYRWYDGGWLIIEPAYYQTGSIVREVKVSLAQDGYYNGHINDHIGSHTRQAIASYQTDNGLPVNGQIDEPLLVSLRLE